MRTPWRRTISTSTRNWRRTRPVNPRRASKSSMAEVHSAEELHSPLPFTLKEGDTFLLANALGDVHGGADGLFMRDTRLLSRFELTVADRTPSLLGSAISHDNTTFTAHLTNRPLPAVGEPGIPPGVI